MSTQLPGVCARHLEDQTLGGRNVSTNTRDIRRLGMMEQRNLLWSLALNPAALGQSDDSREERFAGKGRQFL